MAYHYTSTTYPGAKTTHPLIPAAPVQMNAPIAAAPGAMPDEDTADEKSAMVLRLARVIGTVKVKVVDAVDFLQVQAGAARTRIGDVAGSARSKATSFAKIGQEKVDSAIGYAKEAATGASGIVTSRFSKILSSVGETKALATDFVFSLKAAGLARVQGAATSARSLADDAIGRAKVTAESMWARVSKGRGVTVVWGALESVQARALGSVKVLQDKLAERTATTRSACVTAYGKASEQAIQATSLAKAKTLEIGAAARVAAADPKVQCTAASAAGGAAAMGATGGATGLAAGGTLGAAIGIVPALFTFGLSIPIGAAIGGGTGLVLGTAIGSTVGAVTGGAAGNLVYSKKDDISSGASSTLTTVNVYADYVKGRARDSTSYAKEAASKLRMRFAGGSK